MIYTSYFAKLKKLPENINPISICGKSPYYYDGNYYRKLAPSWDIFSEWKESTVENKNDIYTKRFNDEILSKLNVEKVIEELYHFSNKENIALICYEKSSDFCHRHLVAKWLIDNGHDVKEL